MNKIFSILAVCVGMFTMSSNSLAARFDEVRHRDWQGWSFDYQVSGSFDGLSLTKVKYQGVDILNKASLPVMRVYYDRDVCGPYADRLGGRLTPVSWANNDALVLREFTQSGRQWLELGIQDTIGNYVIYQSWYLSADGILDGHIFSKGLQCNIDHIHYPYWRMDFDLAGEQNDQLRKFVNNNWQIVTTESNDSVTTANNHRWQVRDTLTGDSVDIEYGAAGWNDINGTVNPYSSFANNRILGRRYHSSEDEGWTYGAQSEVPFDNNESINDQDIVVWYKGYLPHDAAEGPDLWHSTGVRLVINLASVTPPGNSDPTISPVENQTNQVGDSVSLQITANDSDGDTLSYSASDLPAGLNINSDTGVISGTLTTDAVSTINVTVDDGNAGSTQITFTWTVTAATSSDGIIDMRVSASSDDAEERSSGQVIIGSSDLDLVASGGSQTVGIRFNGVTIPRGATIANAYIQFTAANARSSTTSLTLKGEAADNATTFLRGNNNVSSRPVTTASVSWSPAPWAATGDAGLEQRTPSLKSVIQEIVNRANWASNHSLAIIITGTGKREGVSYEGDSAAAPVLHVEFGNVAGNQPPTASITSPTNGLSSTLGDNITFNGSASDVEDGNVSASLSWTSNLDGAIGSGASFSITTLSEGAHTITATATDSDGLTSSDTITINVLASGGGTTRLSIPINSGSDDIEEKPDGNVIIGSTDLDLVASGGNQTIGMRFNTVNVPQGSTIVSAYIQFTAAKARSTTTSLTLKGEAADNATTFRKINNNLSTRSTTTASMSWSPVPWATAGDAGVDQRTPDLTSIVQEIVNRANWANNNSLAIIVTGSGKREATSFEANTSAAPVLHLEYQ
ncbi:MAG: putative Ig domain-containing protein [Methylococcales bacterium]